MEIAEAVKMVANYGIGVVCAAVVIGMYIYQTRVTIPRMLETFRVEIQAERQQCHEDHEKMSAILQDVQTALTRLLDRFDHKA